MGDVAVQEPLTADVETTPSKKGRRSSSRFRKFVAVACLAMAAGYACFAYQNRPSPEIDYAEIVPPVVMISATHDQDGEGWLADGKALEPEAAGRVRTESQDIEEDGNNQSLIVWRRFEALRMMTVSDLELFDGSGNRVPVLGGFSSSSNGWSCVSFGFGADVVLPEVVDLKWRFGLSEDQKIGSIEPDGSNLPIYLPDGSRVIQVGDSTELFDHEVEPNQLYVRTEQIRRPDKDVSITFKPQWRFPFVPPHGAGGIANRQQCLSQMCN